MLFRKTESAVWGTTPTHWSLHMQMMGLDRIPPPPFFFFFAGEGQRGHLKIVNKDRHILSLVPRPPPRLYLAAVEKSFLHGCEIKSGRRPGNEASIYSLCKSAMTFILCTSTGGKTSTRFQQTGSVHRVGKVPTLNIQYLFPSNVTYGKHK